MITTTTEKTWSEEQRAIFRHFAAGKSAGNLVVRARAGTGKTTTIVAGIGQAPEQKILLAAFNKRIATELQAKVRNPRAEVKTLHSLGFAYVRRNWSDVRLDGDGERALRCVRTAAGEIPDPVAKLAVKLLSLAKGCAPLARSGGELVELAYQHDCVPDYEWEDDGWTVERLCDVVVGAMDVGAALRDGFIDFDDMVWLPVRNRWVRPWFELVVIDEAQDMNAAQLIIARGASRGRVVVVGDDRQAIYGFRGADTGSIDRLKLELRAKELSLTTTYRCPRLVVELAARLVPDYRAAPSAPEGTVRELAYTKLVEECRLGDFILSRKNAPLAPVCLAILRTGKRAKIEGKDVGAGLKALCRRLGTGRAADSMPEFLAKLDRWQERETVRAMARGEKGKNRAEYVADQADTLRGLSEGLSGVRELTARIDDLFAEGDVGGPRVVCSTVHRAKGLEAERVYLLVDTFRSAVAYSAFCGDESAQGGYAAVEEENLEYVAVTRAMSELVFVRGEPERKNGGK